MKKDQKNIYRRYFINGAVFKSLMLVAGIFTLSGLSSCKKLTDVKPSGSSLLTSSVFTDSVTVQSALAGMYDVFAKQGGVYRFGMSTLPGFNADELSYVGNSFDSYINNSILSIDGDIAWSNSYGAIYNANAIIEGVTGSGKISVSFQNQAIAEARFIRAFCYFYLVNLYGDVPLVLTTNVNQNAVLSRTPVASVYTQIIADLKFAQSNLRADYSVSGNSRTRVNKWVATAMLARVDLYTSNWVDAEAQATTVINNSSLFSLPTDLATVFTPTSREAIWQLYNDNNGYTWYASHVLPNPVSQAPTYVLTPSLVSAFEAGDARKTNWTNTVAYSGTTYTYPYKYKNITTGANAEYYTMLRLAEQYLIRAEARIQQAGKTAAGIADLNVIRDRARSAPTVQVPNPLPALSLSLNKADALLAVEAERRIELNCEWGHRWFDLKRTGRVNTVIGALKPATWKPTAALYPVPSGERTLNPNLTQNPGYN